MFDRHLIFLVNLLQDVSILRPLAYLAAKDISCAISFLVSDKFVARDFGGKWMEEIHQICRETGGSATIYDFPFSALSYLSGKRGMIVAGSESSLSAHQTTHDVFRVAPSGFIKVTLQHGLECVGFMQSHDHNLKHGRNVTFAADIVCGWCDPSALRSLAPSERSKLYVTGPSIILNQLWKTKVEPAADQLSADEGLVCENMHSVRLSAQGDFKAQFLEIFMAFCARLREQGRRVSLRPHPGGQYVLKNAVALPDNVTLANAPIYKTDLTRYTYGISAPSTIVLDMVLAGIPTAVWTGGDWSFDAENYDGLTFVSSADEWMAFHRDAEVRPEMILARQGRYLSGLRIPTDPQDIYRRFATLLANGTAL